MHLRGVVTPMISANKPYNHHIYIYIYIYIYVYIYIYIDINNIKYNNIQYFILQYITPRQCCNVICTGAGNPHTYTLIHAL